ncbi:MAG TPA: hypothetical protein VEO37_00900, partial [Thermoanaerobaculia bacterium]|nr:hypothetical protein [Thermoanaerobaculia bacterium]
MKRSPLPLWLAFVCLLVLPAFLPRSPVPEVGRVEPGGIRERLAGVSVPFIANAGQTDEVVAYYAPTFAGTVFVTRGGWIVYSLPGGKRFSSRRFSSGRKVGWSLIETVVGGRASPIGSERTSTRVSYFLGNDPSRWSGLETFEGVSLGEVWPGISLALRAHGKNVEKLFTVEPGGDPSQIRLRVEGGRWLRINAAGGLVVGTSLGEVTFTPPLAFQVRPGIKHPVSVVYELCGKEYGFHVGDYDSTLPLLIDPLLQATYMGGSGIDEALALAIHPTSGDVYVAGSTASTNFPGTVGGAQVANGGGDGDAFVARLNSALTTLTQATYLGGSGADVARALAIHPTSGDVYVAGSTASTNFPGTAGGAQAASGGGSGD